MCRRQCDYIPRSSPCRYLQQVLPQQSFTDTCNLCSQPSAGLLSQTPAISVLSTVPVCCHRHLQSLFTAQCRPAATDTCNLCSQHSAGQLSQTPAISVHSPVPTCCHRHLQSLQSVQPFQLKVASDERSGKKPLIQLTSFRLSVSPTLSLK